MTQLWKRAYTLKTKSRSISAKGREAYRQRSKRKEKFSFSIGDWDVIFISSINHNQKKNEQKMREVLRTWYWKPRKW